MVVAADGYEEQDDLDVVEDVDPLLAFRSLSTNVEHAVGEVASVEDGLANAGGAESCTEDVLVGGGVVTLE